MRPSTSETYGNIRKYPSALQLQKIWWHLFVGSFFVHFVEDPLGVQRLQQKVWSVTTLFAARCPPKPLCPWHFDPPKPSNQKGGKMGKALTRGTCAVLPLVVLNKLSLEHQREAFTRYHNIVSHVVLHGTQCWVKIAQNLSNTPLHISIHYQSLHQLWLWGRFLFPVVKPLKTYPYQLLIIIIHHDLNHDVHPCHPKWSHDFKGMCITHTHISWPIASHRTSCLAFCLDQRSGARTCSCPGCRKSEVRICHAQLNLLNLFNCSRTAWILFRLVRMTKLHNRAICVTLFKTMPALEKQNK